jgi:hypothetical protein
LGREFLDKNFFRMQLDRMFGSVDGIGLYNPSSDASTLPENHAWWEALEEFMQYIHSPTQFTVTVEAEPESFSMGRGSDPTPLPPFMVSRWQSFLATLSSGLGQGLDVPNGNNASASQIVPPNSTSTLMTYGRRMFVGSSYQSSDNHEHATTLAANRFGALVGSSWAAQADELYKSYASLR